MLTRGTAPPFLPLPVETRGNGAKHAQPTNSEYLLEADLSTLYERPHSHRRSARRGRRRNSSDASSQSRLSTTMDPFFSTAAIVAVGRTCPDLNGCDGEGSDEDATLIAWARRPKAWQQRAAPRPKGSVPTREQKAAEGGSPGVLSPIGDVLAEVLWKDLSLMVTGPWRAAEGEDGDDAPRSLHRSPRGGELNICAPPRDPERAACVRAHCGGRRSGRRDGSGPAAAVMDNHSFDSFQHSVGESHFRANNSFQYRDAAKDAKDLELLSILLSGNNDSTGSYSLPLKGEDIRGTPANGSILVDSDNSNRDISPADRTGAEE
ncbi:hypothetical protein STCU_10764 [Strigomonas culicis]|uniref:Uncharacterized protein n=1 Tax=Strigomonas culicis TaxID=28005 RepID=S9TGN3_9TRYP|nr:hypothetical protein STCU_10764 [Strigomonas culicis]|eukprot:EPY17197.1 hypothetical protein STCU_10764 [Strigomonas culicis]